MGNLNEELSEKIISMSGLSHFYDKINDRFISCYKELVNDAEEGSLAIITSSEEPKSINDYLEFNPDSIALTGFNLPTEVDDSMLSPLADKALHFLPTGYTSLNQIGNSSKGFALSFMKDGENTAFVAMIPELGGDLIYLYTNMDPDSLNSINITTNGVQSQAVNELNQYISSIGNLKFYGLIYGDVGEDFWFTDIEITQEEIDSINYLLLNNIIPTDLYIRRNNTWQNITGDVNWLKNLNNIANNIDSNQINFEMDSRIKDFVDAQGIEYNMDDINPNTIEGMINYNAYISAAALTEARAANGSGVSEISGLINLKNPESVKEAQLSLEDKQCKTFIVTDSDGNYPSPLVNTVYLDDMNGLMDLFYRGNDLALRHILNNGEAYYKYLGTWSSENIRKYVKLPQFNLQTVKVGDLVTIIRHDFTSDEFYSKYIDFNSIVIDNSVFQTAKTLAGYGSKSDGEYIKHMIVSGNIYSAESDPNNSSAITYPLSINGKVQFYTAQITPNTQNVYSGEFWTGNMTGPGIYSYVTSGRPDGSDNDEFYTGYVSPNGSQTLISMKNPSKVFTRPNLNSSWSLGGVQKIINDDLYRTKYGYGNIADSCLKTGINAYFNDTIGGISGNWSLFVTCSFDGDPNYYHLLQTAVGRDASSNLGKIFQRMGWYKSDGTDLNFTKWVSIPTKEEISEMMKTYISNKNEVSVNPKTTYPAANIGGASIQSLALQSNNYIIANSSGFANSTVHLDANELNYYSSDNKYSECKILWDNTSGLSLTIGTDGLKNTFKANGYSDTDSEIIAADMIDNNIFVSPQPITKTNTSGSRIEICIKSYGQKSKSENQYTNVSGSTTDYIIGTGLFHKHYITWQKL